MVVFILVGAILVAVIFQGIQFSLLGAFMGFLLGRLNQLSQQVNQLNQQLNKLKHRSTRASQPKIEPKKLPTTNINETPVEPIFVTRSTAKSVQPDEQKISTSSNQANIPEVPQRLDKITPQPAVSTKSSQPVSSNNKTSVKQTNQREPDVVSKIINFIIGYFTQGNVVVRVGAVVLFFGVAFLLKYAAENTNVSMEVRLIAVATGALALLIFGWRLRNKNQGYGLILQGTAVGILYLTLFASFRLYDMLPAALAFSLLILFSGFAMTLAVLQNSLSLAILSVTGGFLAPILTSTGSGNHVALFGYYSVLNIGIFAVAWFKSWRLLNLIGFVFTFLISTAWGVTKYQASDFITTEPFLILFFLLYSAIALLFATKQKPSLKGYLDATLVFGLPLISFSLQAAMVQDYQYGLAWSAFALGGFYLFSAYLVLKGKSQSLKVIAEAYLALGIIFVSLVIPFALDGQWTAASWAIEGAGLVWVGLRQSRWFAKYFGALIQFVGGFIFLTEIIFNGSSNTLFNSEMLGILFVSVAALFSSFQIWQRKSKLPQFEAISYLIFLIWGLLWWYVGGMGQVINHLSKLNEINGLVLFVSFSGLVWYAVERYYRWPVLSHLMWITFILLTFIGFAQLDNEQHLFKAWSTLFWVFAIASFYGCLYHREQQQEANRIDNNSSEQNALLKLPVASNILHFCGFIALVSLSVIEINWLVNYFELGNSGWGMAILGLLAALWLFLVSQPSRWPMVYYPRVYLLYGVNVLLFAAAFWSVFINFSHSGQALPLTYIPILNPLDIAQGLVLVLVYSSIQKQIREGFGWVSDVVKIIIAAFIFIWLNVILLRSIHAWSDIPYQLNALFSSFLVQTSLSIFWTVIGLAGTIFGASVKSRKIWIVAAGLIGVVVLKLFTIDLDASSSIERIISFVVVGLLLLIVGYFSPLPAKQESEIEGKGVNNNE